MNKFWLWMFILGFILGMLFEKGQLSFAFIKFW